ncbi:phosphoglycolate phosphatase [Jannaschia sp. KMU-145]|uniref:phosphoglycolate phosphatase n=1 Tax=Jannaschia halovivens TaxID=3388667 RepID=UPI00396B0BF0
MTDAPLPYAAYVFDLDGTLIDSAPGIHAAVASMCAELDLPAPDLETMTGFIGNGVPTLIARVLAWAEADPDRHPEALAAFTRAYEADPAGGTTILPGVPETLRALATRGARIGLCTNKPAAPARAILDLLALGPFHAVAGGDTLSVHKPDPAPLLHVIAALGATPDTTLYIGDSAVDWTTADAANVDYAHLHGGYQNGRIPAQGPAQWIDILSDLLP